MKNVFDVNLIVGSVKNDHCVKVSMPTTNNDLKKRLKIISAKKKSDYEILHSDCDDLYIEKNTDIFKLNEQLNTLKGLGKSMNEILAVKEAYMCNSLEDVINCITTKDYEFYDYDDGFEEFKDIYGDDILSNVPTSTLYESLYLYFFEPNYIIDRCTNEELLGVLDEGKMAEALENTYATKAGMLVVKD